VELTAGQVAVVTGGGSGIGLALAERFARSGLSVVLADIDADALDAATKRVGDHGVDVLARVTDVGDMNAVNDLAAATIERFGAVHVVCNNAGVVSRSDPWFGPIEAWQWVLDVNMWSVVYGVRAFLPHLLGGGHIVNTASIAGLMPGFGASYDATKHAVVAITEDLYHGMRSAGLPVGVSVLCPGWVRTKILDAERNWPTDRGALPDAALGTDIMMGHVQRAIDEATPPAVIADLVADAITAERFWVLPHADFVDIAVQRWHSIAEGINPEVLEAPGLPPIEQLRAEVMASLEAL
jgi:NAD(P)-dependent dehydrogenase (short-subunit alcohol dehydrogenase family)